MIQVILNYVHSILSEYQNDLFKKMKGNDFVFLVIIR